jgi:hypothetical protein
MKCVIVFRGCWPDRHVPLEHSIYPALTSRLTCLHTLLQQSHIHPQWRLLFSLSLRLLSVGIAFNVLGGRSLTACPPLLLHSHPLAPQFTLRLNCPNVPSPSHRPTKSWTIRANPESEADTVFQSVGWHSRPPLWSSGQSSWLQNGGVLCFLSGTNWIYICYVEESRPLPWSNGQSSWLQIWRSGLESQHYYQIFWEVVGLERGPLSC